MKAIFVHWHNRIAPVFDSAQTMRLVTAATGAVTASYDMNFISPIPEKKIEQLITMKADLLVCGAICRTNTALLEAGGIKVLAFRAGELEAVIDAWLSDDLSAPCYFMPGCGSLKTE